MITRAMIERAAKRRLATKVAADDHRVAFFREYLKQTKGLPDARLKEFLFKLPTTKLRMIQEIYHRYPGHTPEAVTSFASRAHEILEAKKHLGRL